MKRKTFIIIGAIFTLAIILVAFRAGKPGEIYQFAEVKRGDLLVSIGATGTVEPEEVVDVGAQVAGRIVSFGKDSNGREIDYGSLVEEGTVLAQIDDSLYAADVAVDEALAGQARAQLLLAQAKLTEAERNWNRAQKVGPSQALSPTLYDNYKAGFEIAQATVATAQASIAQAEAALLKARRNLGYTVIKSPVKGVIIDRRVNIGQTVVSSLNAPSLFLIAKDLSRLEAWVAVNEADIGSIRPGQPATFTVDAYPGEVFGGEVKKIRLNASMTQNVVTYTVEVSVDNSKGRLIPYLTANMQFEVSRRQQVLLVPNAAFRFTPSSSVSDDGGASAAESSPQEKNLKRLWIADGESIRPVTAKAGGTDGTMTEVESPDLKEGTKVVIGEEMPDTEASGGSKNPFTPNIRPGGRRG